MHSETVLFTIKEMAERLRISAATAYALVKQGKIASLRVGDRGGAIRIRESDLQTYLYSVTRQPVQTASATKPVQVRLKHLKLR